jgi:sulfite exporter TauE/SafE
MVSFGVGTLPILVGLTAFNAKLNSILNRNSVRLTLGFIVILMALNQMYVAVAKLQVLH